MNGGTVTDSLNLLTMSGPNFDEIRQHISTAAPSTEDPFETTGEGSLGYPVGGDEDIIAAICEANYPGNPPASEVMGTPGGEWPQVKSLIEEFRGGKPQGSRMDIRRILGSPFGKVVRWIQSNLDENEI